jgi:glutathione S-transferase
MRILYHLWMSSECRKVRIVLHEKQLDFKLYTENVEERRPEFLALNPAGEIPVLIESNGMAISGGGVITEYLDEVYPSPTLIGQQAIVRAEVRRLIKWFDEKFNREVSDNLVGQKLLKRYLGQGGPRGAAVRAGHTNIHYHLDYISYLIERRRWLAGDDFSLADIAAAAHLSLVDYLGDVPWTEHVEAKNWYARVKSRPSFQPILEDRIPGTPPQKQYANLDF